MATKKVKPEELLDFTDEEIQQLHAADSVSATADGPVGVGGPLRERLGIFRRRAVSRLVNHEGMGRAEAIAAVGAFGDGKILEWIIAHGPEIIAFVKMIISLFL